MHMSSLRSLNNDFWAHHGTTNQVAHYSHKHLDCPLQLIATTPTEASATYPHLQIAFSDPAIKSYEVDRDAQADSDTITPSSSSLSPHAVEFVPCGTVPRIPSRATSLRHPAGEPHLPIRFSEQYCSANKSSEAERDTQVVDGTSRGKPSASQVGASALSGKSSTIAGPSAKQASPTLGAAAVLAPHTTTGASAGHALAITPPPGLDLPTASVFHRGVPEEQWPAGVTSVMLRNIPNRYTPEELLHDLIERGFEGAFDFFYLPTDFATKKNKGYGFVNLLDSGLALALRDAFHGHQLTRYVTQKVLELTPATTQGFEGNAIKYLKHQAGRVQNPWFKPMIFVKGDSEDARDVCLPLAEENLPAWLRGKIGTRPQPSQAKQSTCVEDDTDHVHVSSRDVDADAMAHMEDEVRKFLASCEANDEELLALTRKSRSNRRRGGKAARK